VSAIGDRPSAIGPRPSALGSRLSALGARRSAGGELPSSRSRPQDLDSTDGRDHYRERRGDPGDREEKAGSATARLESEQVVHADRDGVYGDDAEEQAKQLTLKLALEVGWAR
jgi:hypothetical protein